MPHHVTRRVQGGLLKPFQSQPSGFGQCSGTAASMVGGRHDCQGCCVRFMARSLIAQGSSTASNTNCSLSVVLAEPPPAGRRAIDGAG